MIRQPIVSILGHVDHGKTLLLDRIRGCAVAAKEAGGITKAIGATIISIETIKKICGKLLDSLNIKLTLPGLLFIDTPGHAAFVNLRKRGGNLADIAILVININEGLMPQTIESINILKQYKTPFIIAVNKIDLVNGWRSQKEKSLLKSISEQSDYAVKEFETKLYTIVGKLFELGFESDRFDRVNDYTKQIAIVPVSAMTGEGISELLMVLTGLAQRFLEKNLKLTEGPAKGTILEVKEQKGLGKVIDVIIYDGQISVGDTIILGSLNEAIVTKVKGLFEPAHLTDMREQKSKFNAVKKISAATGVRIVATNLENVFSGMPIFVADKNIEELKSKVQEEVEQVIVENQNNGIIIKADSLGSLEALSFLLKEKNIPIRKSSIGPINKKDVSDAESIYEKDPLNSMIIGFNIPKPAEEYEKVKIITNDIIYKLIEDFEAWQLEQKRKIELKEIENLVQPCKIQLLRGYVFRQSNPAVVGVEVLLGTLKSNTPLINTEGKYLTTVKGIQKEQENVDKSDKNQQVAVSLPDVIIGRQLKEGDILYSEISEAHFRKFKEFKKYLTNDQKEVLKEVSAIMRRNNPVWGV